jgi:hypothetical protein
VHEGPSGADSARYQSRQGSGRPWARNRFRWSTTRWQPSWLASTGRASIACAVASLSSRSPARFLPSARGPKTGDTWLDERVQEGRWVRPHFGGHVEQLNRTLTQRLMSGDLTSSPACLDSGGMALSGPTLAPERSTPCSSRTWMSSRARASMLFIRASPTLCSVSLVPTGASAAKASPSALSSGTATPPTPCSSSHLDQ